MARIARVVVPNVPYHILNRGNHRQEVFILESDKLLYLKLLGENGKEFEISFLAYCLMDNHLHLVAIPKTKDSFAKGFGETNRKYSSIINIRESWTGQMWQGRFKSFPMDESYLFEAVRYTERNPVRAGLVKKASDFLWSSAAAHITGAGNPLLALCDPSKYISVDDWVSYLDEDNNEDSVAKIRKHTRSGRPLGSESFVVQMEALTGRKLTAAAPGRRRRVK
ncbi:MAG: transposase [Candidatus Aminicenantes bacterium]|nr:transposase [Candidatus Aminicenantes bacterium]